MKGRKLTKPEFSFITIVINLSFMACIVMSLAHIFQINTERDINYIKTNNELVSKLNESQLFNISNDMKNEIELLNKNIENSLLKSDIEEIKDNPKKVYNLISKEINDASFNKNSLIIGTKDGIIYNNSVDAYNVLDWEDIFNKSTINNLLSDNIEKLYIQYTNNNFRIVPESEIVLLLNTNPEKLKSYDIMIASHITETGDITGNSDIVYNDKNITSKYKILMLYRENLYDLYYKNPLSFRTVNNEFDISIYKEYIMVITVLIAWFMFLIVFDKNDKIRRRILNKEGYQNNMTW